MLKWESLRVLVLGGAGQCGIEPRIAMLSYSTGASGKGEDVEKVREATRIARGNRDTPISTVRCTVTLSPRQLLWPC